MFTRAGLGLAGMARAEEEAATPKLYEVDGISAVPTWVDRRSYTIIDVGEALMNDTYPDLASRLKESWDRTWLTLRSYGVDVTSAPPAAPANIGHQGAEP